MPGRGADDAYRPPQERIAWQLRRSLGCYEVACRLVLVFAFAGSPSSPQAARVRRGLLSSPPAIIEALAHLTIPHVPGGSHVGTLTSI